MNGETPIAVLDLTTDTLEGDMTAAGTDVIYNVLFWDNYGDDRPQRLAKKITASNDTTAVTICSAPPQASVSREVLRVTVYNGNAATRVVSVSVNENTTVRTLVTQSLLTTQTLQGDHNGWSVI